MPNTKLSVKQIIERNEILPCDDVEDGRRCATMSARGQCDTSPGWMQVMCAASCNSCEMLDSKVRCNPKRLNISLEPAYQPGELNQMFESIPERFPNLKVKFLSRPPKGPYILEFEDFLSNKEIDAMLNNVGILKRSTDQGKLDKKTGIQEQKVSKTRTSSNAWCTGQCAENEDVKAVQKRIADIIQVNEKNFESFQMLRYEIGQEYQRHHDMSTELAKNLAGPRVLTFFLYLSEVEEGGGTKFTDLEPPIVMVPKKGSAILWPSVENDNLYKQDKNTFHQALPVIKGRKYGANSWIHLYDYVTPNHYGCTGSFA